MANYEIVLKGFDGGDDKTDHLIVWVSNTVYPEEYLYSLADSFRAATYLLECDVCSGDIDYNLDEVEEFARFIGKLKDSI